jgi:hypothetical protein
VPVDPGALPNEVTAEVRTSLHISDLRCRTYRELKLVVAPREPHWLYEIRVALSARYFALMQNFVYS